MTVCNKQLFKNQTRETNEKVSFTCRKSSDSQIQNKLNMQEYGVRAILHLSVFLSSNPWKSNVLLLEVGIGWKLKIEYGISSSPDPKLPLGATPRPLRIIVQSGTICSLASTEV